MKKLIIPQIVVILVFASCLFGQDSEIPNGPWTDLFNGKNLDNWNFSGDPPWHVEDNLIKASGGDNKTYLLWPEPIKNLELKIRYKLSSKGANSGIQVHSFCKDRKKSLPDCGGSYVVCGPQLDVAMSYSGRLFNECTGFLVQKGQNIDECRRTLEVGKWMETSARVKDNKISLWFNGTHCLDYTFKNIENIEGDIFGIQSHPPYDLIEWEYIKIRDLDKPDVKGCTNPNSSNYNATATVDDSSCLACTDKSKPEYDLFCESHKCVNSCPTGIGLVEQDSDRRISVSIGVGVSYSIDGSGPYRLKLLDLAGNVVLARSAEGPVLNQVISLPSKGVFIVQIETDYNRYQKKLIKL